jgi:hypothetical protein
MKKSIFFLFVFLLQFTSNKILAQSSKGKCDVVPGKIVPVNVSNTCRSYSITINNNSKKTVDALEWTVYGYNKFKRLVGSATGTWSSGYVIPSIKPGSYTVDVEFPDGLPASDYIYATITAVHFTDDTVCE